LPHDLETSVAFIYTDPESECKVFDFDKTIGNGTLWDISQRKVGELTKKMIDYMDKLR